MYDLNALGTWMTFISGSGLLYNSGAAATLTIGTDNSNSTFSGLFGGTLANAIALTKVGSGNLTFQPPANVNAATPLGAFTVNGGSMTFNSASPWYVPASWAANTSGTLYLDDNTNGNVINRLGTKALTLGGGGLSINWPAAGAARKPRPPR